MTELDVRSTAARESRIPGASVFGDAFAHLLDLPPATQDVAVSETVERHRASFARTWPEPVSEEPYRLPPTPPKTAVAATSIEDLGDGRSKRTQAAKAAEAGGWSWSAHLADAPDGEGGRSVVMRFRLPGSMPWDHRRVVAYWSAKPGKSLAWVAGYAWRVYGGQVIGERTTVAAKDLAAYLREPPPVEPTRRPPPRRRSNLDLSARW